MTRSASSRSATRTTIRRQLSLALLIVITLGASGCYLSHVAIGQTRLLRARQSIRSVLADPATSIELRNRLELVQRVRAYATELGLEVGGQYTSFAPWPGDRIVTSVVASRPGEVTPAGFSFPLIGRLPYKSFFDRELANAEAASLRAEGMDVCISGIAAYSTLGWLDDPITGPMLRRGDGALVETILHELVHATVYIKGHADFNEGVANFIGQEASVAFYLRENQRDASEKRRHQIHDARLIEDELLRFRDELIALYASDTEPAKLNQMATRQEFEAQARQRIAGLSLQTRDAKKVAESLRLNDACLALRGTYSANLSAFRDTLTQLDGDLFAFVARLKTTHDAADPLKALLEL
jgi:predicted aminopeptidase